MNPSLLKGVMGEGMLGWHDGGGTFFFYEREEEIELEVELVLADYQI